mgnify:FL=1
MRLRALAKINLGLDILRKREDGYHEVRMIMQTIQMYDVLEMKRVRKRGFPCLSIIPIFRMMNEIWCIRRSKASDG